MTRFSALLTRMDQFDQEVSTLRNETSHQINDFRDAVLEQHTQTERHQQNIDGMNVDLVSLRKRIQEIEEIDVTHAIDKQKEEDIRLARAIEEIKASVNEMTRFDEDYKRSLRMMEEAQRQESKRLTDMQGEIASIRKRSDETRGKQDLLSDSMRKLDVRINDLLQAESERRESQTAFIEKINVAQVNRDRMFRDWSERFDLIEQITSSLEEKTMGLENIQRSVKTSQAGLDDVTQRFERRINEITEVQRLNEDRFRQEWTTFKSDDQKRWSNYVISQDEQHREMNRSLEDLNNHIVNIEDQLEILQQILQQFGRENIRNLQNELNVLRESIDSNKNIFKE
jgi:chromosome segregation ATPase